MGLKAKDVKQRLSELREENKDNPNYPRLKMVDGLLGVDIHGKIFKDVKEKMFEKFKNEPYFLEEYEDLINNENDFIAYNMELIDRKLKSKFE